MTTLLEELSRVKTYEYTAEDVVEFEALHEEIRALKKDQIPRDKIEIGGKVGYDFYTHGNEPRGRHRRKACFRGKHHRGSKHVARGHGPCV